MRLHPRQLAVPAASLALAVVAATPAAARVPGIGNGLQVTTDGPDLRSAVLVADPARKLVDACFDSPLAERKDSAFVVVGYDAARFVRAVSTEYVPGTGGSCVRARFSDRANLAEGSILVLEDAAVRDAAGRFSAPSSEPLEGSSLTPLAGRTTGPDLVRVQISDAPPPDPDGTPFDPNPSADNPPATGGTITYVFDEPLDPGATPNPSLFGYADDVTGDSESKYRYVTAYDPAAATVSVAFDQTNGAPALSNSTRAYAKAGAVQDVPASANSQGGTAATPSAGDALRLAGTAGRPALLAARPDGARRWLLTYDTAVDRVTNGQSKIRAITDDAATFTPTNIETFASSTDQVRVTFGAAVGDDPSAIVRVVDLGGAVESRVGTGTGTASLYGSAAAGTAPARPGFTNGPDLLSATYDPGDTSVTYRFDEDVVSFKPAQFFVMAQSSAIEGPRGSSVELGPTVDLVFGDPARSAVGAGARDDAVRDGLGNPSPESVVDFDLEQEASAPPPPPPAAPAPAPAAPAAQRPTFATTISAVRRGRLLRGRVRSPGRGCQFKRVMVLKRYATTQRKGKKRRTLTVRKVRTQANGTFRLRIPARQRGRRVFLYVAVREATAGSCLPARTTSVRVPRGA
jgi:hypothetical protein